MLTSLIEKIAANLLTGVLVAAATGGGIVGVNVVTNGAIEQALPAFAEVIDLPGGEPRDATGTLDEATPSPSEEGSPLPSDDPSAAPAPVDPACPAGYAVAKVEQEGGETSFFCQLAAGATPLTEPLCPAGASVEKRVADSSGGLVSYRCKIGDDDLDEDTDEDADEDGSDEDGSEDDDSSEVEDDDSGSDDDSSDDESDDSSDDESDDSSDDSGDDSSDDSSDDESDE